MTVSRQTGGKVTSPDGLIDCGTVGTRCGPVEYSWTQAVTLVAEADAGNMFGTWVGDCTGRSKVNDRYTCVLDTTRYGADKFVGAVFGEAGRTQHTNFSDPAVHGPEFLSWVANKPDSFECTYCHGAAYSGVGIALSCNSCHERAGFPSWQTDCNFCHGQPPLGGAHPAVSDSLPGCSTCHKETVGADGAIIPGGKHMNGHVDASGHGVEYLPVAVHGPLFLDSFVNGASSCSECHGDSFGTAVGSGYSCNSCHGANGWSNWQTDCTFCHGEKHGTGLIAAAPPDAISQRLDGQAAPLRTGAHRQHLTGVSGTTVYSAPIPCSACHVVPTTVEVFSHIDGSNASAAVVLADGNYASGTCTTSCHGSSSSPSWDSSGVTCKTCHPTAQLSTHVPMDSATTVCSGCHGLTVKADGTIDVDGGKHINGAIDFTGGSGGGCTTCHQSPPASGAHATHSKVAPTYGDTTPFGCGNCHPADQASHMDGTKQVVLSAAVTLPGGTTTAGAQSSGTGTSTSCTVACHYPLGAPRPSQGVSWSATGPLACTSCHSSVAPGGTMSKHDPMFADALAPNGATITCWSCHDSSAHAEKHLSGDPGLLAASTVDAVCLTCHGGGRKPVVGETISVASSGSDWTISRRGDFEVDGYTVGGTVTVSGSGAGNDGTYAIAGLAHLWSGSADSQNTTTVQSIVSNGVTTIRATFKPSTAGWPETGKLYNFLLLGFVPGCTVSFYNPYGPTGSGTYVVTAVTATDLTLAPGYSLPAGTVSYQYPTVRCYLGSSLTLAPPGKTLSAESSSAITLSAGAGAEPLGSGTASRTPPQLLGWTTLDSDTPNGDFHGGRRGTGYGGTLVGHSRGEAALSCLACHVAHASPNAFLLATRVNGAAIAGNIGRSGVGAESLCAACHQDGTGEYPKPHSYCISCHGADPAPAGTTCFWCHGHEGISQMMNVTPGNPPGHYDDLENNSYNCDHCHGPSNSIYSFSSFAMPTQEAAAPTVNPLARQSPAILSPSDPWLYPSPSVLLAPNQPVVFNVGRTYASIYWETNEASTTFVEYGVGTPNLTAGFSPFVPWNPRFDTSYPDSLHTHRVDLTGLQPGTTYVFRVRSSDQLRNERVGTTYVFTTAP